MEAQGAVKYPVLSRIHLPSKNYLAPNVSDAKVEEPDPGVLTLQLTFFGYVLSAGGLPVCAFSLVGQLSLPFKGIKDRRHRPQQEIGALCPAGRSQASPRTASDSSLLGFTHLQRSGEQRWLVGSGCKKLPGRQ